VRVNVPHAARIPDVAISTPEPPSVSDRAQRPESEPDPPSWLDRTPSSVTGVFSLITKNVAATARGTLGKTPLAHLLVYVLEHRLSGTLVLTPAEESGIQHGIHFDQGVATQVWTPAGVAPLATMLCMCGHLGEDQLADPALFLVTENEPALEAELSRCGYVTGEQIAEARALQLVIGTEFLFTLPPTTEYAFFAEVNLVQPHVGSIVGGVQPLELVMLGVRKRADDAMMMKLLERLGDEPLVLAQGMRGTGFGYELEEAAVFEALALGEPSLPELLDNPLLDAAAVRRVIYVLLLTRGIVLGDGASQRPPIDNPSSSSRAP